MAISPSELLEEECENRETVPGLSWADLRKSTSD
jgi:hypothetical protein